MSLFLISFGTALTSSCFLSPKSFFPDIFRLPERFVKQNEKDLPNKHLKTHEAEDLGHPAFAGLLNMTYFLQPDSLSSQRAESKKLEGQAPLFLSSFFKL
ncbi:hypothetical protein K9L63_02825 [Candidatus Gracilibacteria bacterium]|nr:hypothetical protein [Candidatus Gracilibacteria bacterium]